ncbi:MAG: MarC family protein [Bosea sp. (in: a-proteobacteria)]
MTSKFLQEFFTLFAIINPLGLAFVFLNRTMSLSDAERAVVARQVAIYAFFVLIVSMFAGSAILGFFGVSLPALRIAGGLVVAASGWALLHESSEDDGRKATSTHGLESVRRMSFFPLTVPLTTGPGTIAVAITLGSRQNIFNFDVLSEFVSVAVSAAIAGTIFYAYAHVSRMARLFGAEGTRVIMRLSAFLLLCIGVQIIITGVVEIMTPFLGSRS